MSDLKYIGFKLDPDHHAELRKEAHDQRRPLAQFMRILVENHLEEKRASASKFQEQSQEQEQGQGQSS